MSRRAPIVPTVIVVAAVATMVALGFWQLRRLEEKEAMIEVYEVASDMSGLVPWPRTEAELEARAFRISILNCERVLGIDSRAARNLAGEMGWGHFARCELDGGRQAEVGIGWTREPTTPSWKGGPVDGTIGPSGNLIASDVMGLAPLARPDPNDLPNNHLMYAGQWFFFALTALVIYGLALRKRWRGS